MSTPEDIRALLAKADTLIDVTADLVEAIGVLRTETEAQRVASDLRDQLLRTQVEARLDVHTEATKQSGAPWRLVYMLLGANAVGALAFLSLLLLLIHLYSQVTGSDPGAAFDDTRHLLPVITGQSSPDAEPLSKPLEKP